MSAYHGISSWWLRRLAVSLLWALGAPVCGWFTVVLLSAAGNVLAAHLGSDADNTGRVLGALWVYSSWVAVAAVPVLLVLGLLGRLPGTRRPGTTGSKGQSEESWPVISMWLRKLVVTGLWAAGAFVGVAWCIGYGSAATHAIGQATSVPTQQWTRTAQPLLLMAPQVALVLVLILGLGGVLPGTRLRSRGSK